MNDQAIAYYAAKYFPHLLPIHGQACIRAILIANGILKENP